MVTALASTGSGRCYFGSGAGAASVKPITDWSLPSAASLAKTVPLAKSGASAVPPAVQVKRT